MAERTPPNLARRRILVVEDEYLIAMDMALALESFGAEVIGPAGSVAEALELADAEAGRIDGAVLDVNLSGERVYPVARVLRERGVPFIFASGYDANLMPDEFAAVPRCPKPIDKMQVARLLAAHAPGPADA